MKKRNIGRTGLMVSELSFGAGGFWGMKIFDESKARIILESAIENGINFIDTGPNYSNANAEPRLGRMVKSYKDSVYIGTKVGTKYVNGKHIKDFSPISIRSSVESSLKNLCTDHISFVHFHGFPQYVQDDSIDALIKLKEQGYVRHIGISADGDDAIRAIGKGVFDSIMIEYNILRKDTPKKIIEIARDKGMGVFIKSPLAQTLYSNDVFKIGSLSDIWYLMRSLKNHRSKLIRGRKFRFINHVAGFLGSEIALNYVLNNSGVSSAVIGTVNHEHLLSNIRAIEKEIPRELIEKINSM